MRRSLPVFLLAAPLLAACGGAGEPSQEQARGLGVAFVLPRITALGFLSSRSLLVEAVYAATAAAGTGQIVKAGTLSVGPMGAQYSPQPADRLLAKLGDQTHEFVLTDAQGNMMADSATTWLMSPHVLHYTHRLGDQVEAEIAERFDGNAFEVKIDGWSRLSGARYDVHVTATGQAGGSRDFNGGESQTQYAIKGRVSGNGVEVDVDEQHRSQSASAYGLDLLPSQRGNATRLSTTVNSVVRSGGAEYRFQGVQVQVDHKTKGNDSTTSVSGLEGVVVRDGAPFGRCALVDGRAALVTESGAIPLDVAQ